MRTLQQCLLDTDPVRQRAIARLWDIDLPANHQRDVAAQLAEAMVAPEAIASAWDALSDDQRGALGALLSAGGRMPLRIFTRKWGEIRAMGPGRLEREQPWQNPISPAEGLWYRGFISRAFEQGDEGTHEVVFVPPELQTHLPARPASPPTLILDPAPEPAIVRSAGDAFLDDTSTLLAYLQNERLRARPDDGWPAHHLTRLARRLRDPDATRLALIHHLVQRLGWLRVTDSGRLRPDPTPVAAWLQAPIHGQRVVLAEAWQSDPTWNDLCHVPSLQPEDTGAWHNNPLLARGTILRHLTACGQSTWHRLDDFVAAVKRSEPDFQRPDGDYTSWYIRDRATGNYLMGFESWDSVDGALVRYLISGPLAWLSIVDLGAPSCEGASTVFRLTSAGAALIGLAEPPPEPEPAPLTLCPDFTVLAPSSQNHERFQLARVADWMATPRVEETGGAAQFAYRLTPTSLERARQQGIPVSRVLEFLGRAIKAPVPRFLEDALTRWETRGAEARLEHGMLLRLSSEKLMAQASASPSARRLIQEQIGPTTALVRERDWPRLVVALGEMGILPDVAAVEEDDAE